MKMCYTTITKNEIGACQPMGDFLQRLQKKEREDAGLQSSDGSHARRVQGSGQGSGQGQEPQLLQVRGRPHQPPQRRRGARPLGRRSALRWPGHQEELLQPRGRRLRHHHRGHGPDPHQEERQRERDHHGAGREDRRRCHFQAGHRQCQQGRRDPQGEPVPHRRRRHRVPPLQQGHQQTGRGQRRPAGRLKPGEESKTNQPLGSRIYSSRALLFLLSFCDIIK